jgi:hypothetical protein
MNCIWAVLFVLLGSALAYGGEIRVRVSNAQGVAVAGARVTVAAAGRRGGPAPREEGSTGSDGAHTLPGLEPGSYILTVFVPSERVSFRRPVVLRSASSTVEVNFRVPPAATSPRSGNE